MKRHLKEQYDRWDQELTPEDRVERINDLSLQNILAREKRQTDFGITPLSSYHAEVEEAYLNWGKMNGLSTGYPSLDRMTMGLAPGEMTVIAGATSNGKTALAINITGNVARSEKNVLFVTLEMTKVEAGVRFRHILGTDYEQATAHIFFQKKDELDWRSIDGLMQNALIGKGIELVVIDHLHYFTRQLENVAEDLGNITKELKKNAIRHSIPVILLSHTRKGSGHSDTKTGINDLRGSSYIAQDADIVLMVERSAETPKNIAIKLEKNRNRYGTKIGTEIWLNFDATKITEDMFTSHGLEDQP